MSGSTQEEPARAEALGALADSGRLLSTAMVLFHTNLSRRVGLGPTEEKVLELVQRHGHPSVSELAEQTGLAKNSISDVLDRLESKGFVTREPHPRDGRKVAIVATEEGIARIGRLFIGMMTRLGELNAEYRTEELALIAEYQRRAAEIQAAEARNLAEGTA
ncbi:MarR family transcriptional regulator [Micromonospora sp. NPDC002389]|uniref:MarR family transcriptional regulator n=1 Tax=Micromonospora sp. NPDC002389 TaxID=3154272 RepID=UPI003321B187